MPTARELNELHCDIQLQRIRERREDREREEAARKEERIQILTESLRRSFGPVLPAAKPKPERIPTKRLTLDELREEHCDVAQDLITGLFRTSTVNIAVGDSGLGKSPLLVQMAICVAMGKPFLGMPAAQSRVLLVDYENSGQLPEFIDTISAFLEVDGKELPRWLEVLPNPSSVEEVVAHVKDMGAGFVTVDSLRGFSPTAEVKSDVAADLIASLQRVPATWLLLHHPRKTDRKAPPPDLENSDVRVMTWLQEAAGARALVNQTFTRIAIDRSDKADLLLRPFIKGKGESGFIYVAREWSEDGTPQGYTQATGSAMLSLNDKAWFRMLAGQTLRYSELPARLDARSEKVAAFVRDCEMAGVAKVGGKANSRTNPRTVTFAETPVSPSREA